MSDYDYTQEGIPTQANPDDYEIPTMAAPDKTADQINAENSFRDMPPGEHLCKIVSFSVPEVKGFTKVMVGRKLVNGVWTGGQMSGYHPLSVQIRFALANEPNCQITDFFVLPPADPAEHDAYLHGLDLDAKSFSKPGFQANKYYHLMGALGFDWAAGQALPAEAKRMGNWKVKADGSARLIYLTAKPSEGTYRKKDKSTGEEIGPEIASSPKVKMFSYRRGNGPAPSGPGTPRFPQATAPVAPATPPAAAPKRATVNSL